MDVPGVHMKGKRTGQCADRGITRGLIYHHAGSHGNGDQKINQTRCAGPWAPMTAEARDDADCLAILTQVERNRAERLAGIVFRTVACAAGRLDAHRAILAWRECDRSGGFGQDDLWRALIVEGAHCVSADRWLVVDA